MNQKATKWGAFFLAAALVLVCFPIAAANLAVESTGGRRIAIVLDNSDSMIIDGPNKPYLSRWAEATYALRTFLYMVKDTDTVRLFTVSALPGNDTDQVKNEKIATVGDVSKGNIDEVLQQVGISYQTKTYGMDAAYSWAAEGGSSDTERWVVILSDGEFYPPESNDTSLSYLESVADRAKQWDARHICTIFVGLDIDNEKLKDLEESYLSIHNTYSSGGSGEKRSIEETILEISEKIYDMKELDDDRLRASTEFTYDQNSNVLTWATEPGLSTYLDQVIIIAQTDMEEGKVPEVPKDPNMQIIQSDSVFSWCRDENLESLLAEHDEHASDNFDFGSPATFRSKIEKTFLGKYCYIRSYSNAEIGAKIEFQAPPGEYTYRIYYELREDVIPELALEQGGTTVLPDGQGIYAVTEGPVQIDFRLHSRETEIPKTLEAVKDGLEMVSVEGTESIGEINFSYDDTAPENNVYKLRVAFNGRIAEGTVEVCPNLQNYLLKIPPGQSINIDQVDDNKIAIETTIPINWLRNHMAGNMTITSERPEFTFDLETAEVGEAKNGVNIISIPIHCSNNLFDISKDFPINVVFSDTNGQLETGGTLSADLGYTEIDLSTPEDAPNLATLEEKSLLYMTARTDTDVTKETTLQKVVMTGQGILEGIPFQYNESAKSIEYAGNWIDTWRLLLTGETSGIVHVEGQVYRRGILIDDHLDLTKTVNWSGSIGELIRSFIFRVIFLVALILLFIFTYRGKLLFQELIDRILFLMVDKEFPLVWYMESTGEMWQITVNNGVIWYPWKLSIAFHMINENNLRDSKQRITLVGTTNGYCMTRKSETSLDQLNITFMNEGYQLNEENQALVFQYTTNMAQVHHILLCHQRKRSRLPGACMICLLTIVLAYVLHMAPWLGCILVLIGLAVIRFIVWGRFF